MTKRYTLDGRDADPILKGISYSKLLDLNELFLEPEICLRILYLMSMSLGMYQLASVSGIMLREYYKTGQVDGYLAKGLLIDLFQGYSDKDLQYVFKTCWTLLNQSLQECSQRRDHIVPLMKAPKDQLILRLLDKKEDTSAEREKRVRLMLALTSVSFVYNCFDLPPDMDGFFEKADIIEIQNPPPDRGFVSDIRHSVSHDNVQMNGEQLKFTNQHGTYKIIFQMDADDFVDSVIKVLHEIKPLMKKHSKPDVSTQILESLIRSIDKGVLIDKYSLYPVLMEIITVLYESHLSAFEGIIDLSKIIGGSSTFQKTDIQINGFPLREIRKNTAHNDFDINSSECLIFTYHGIVFEVDPYNWSEKVTRYRLSCSALQLQAIVIGLNQLSNPENRLVIPS